jgi:hypothetical protein
MADEAIRITVGAVKTASVDRVFADIRKQAARIGQDLNRFLDPRKALKGLQAYKEEFKGLEPLVRQQTQKTKQRYSEEERAAMRALRSREQAERYVHSLRMRQLRTESVAREREDRRQSASLQRAARMTSWSAARGVGSGMHMAGRFAGAIGRGIGLDLSPSSYLQQSISSQSLAAKLASSGWNPSDTKNGNDQFVHYSELQRDAVEQAKKYGISATDVLAGQTAFQKPSGNLSDTRALSDGLARLSVATGSNTADLFGAAGNLINQFEGASPEDRRKNTLDLFKVFARQGQEGAVELEDLAKYGSRLFATAGLYEGDKMDVLKSLGAIGQAARGFGGADSAAQAATSVARLATTFKTGARAKEFQAITGKSVFSDDGSGKIRDPIALIKDALTATQGDPLKWNKIFMNVMSERAAGGIGAKYREAYDKTTGSKKEKDAAGLAAIDEFMNTMKGAQLSESEIEEKVARHNETYAAQTERLRAEFEEVATEFLKEFLPVLREASPHLVTFAKTLGQASTWVLENPKQAIGLAITASIARGGIEAAFRLGIEGMFSGGKELVMFLLRNMLAGSAVPVVGKGGAIVPTGGGKVPLVGAGLGATVAMVAGGLFTGGDNDVNMTPEQRRAKAIAQADDKLKNVLGSGDQSVLSDEFGARINRQVFLEDKVNKNGAAAAGGDAGAGVRAAAYSKELAENRAALQELTRALRNLPNGAPGTTTQAGAANR